MKNINKSHVGTYYCAVASNGQIVFGNGTKLELESEPVLVYILCAALIFTTILSALLAFILYKKCKRDRRQTSVFQGNFSICLAANAEEDSLNYASVNVTQPTRSRRQKKSFKTECVYSSMKQ
ncbi:hypothetical protein ILYODFUR_018572 [Ilyodon furcidens]|uniref:Uncharacterized protein n=1 Tax=Ilyodon furcidens TaxID=33524 RepID=A0ABV0TLL6_9TELE